MKKIAIIGFGFCGRLALYHLAEKLEQGDEIYVFDRNPLTDLGTAFSAFSPYYILNVPVMKMSAFSDKPGDFKNFLETKYPKILERIGENGFAPRQLYGQYLQQVTIETLAKIHQKNIHFEFIQDEVVDVKKDGEKFIIQSEEVKREAFEVMLATSFKQGELPFKFESQNFLKKLWSKNSLPFHQTEFTNETICLIGSGLTAVDVLVGLKNKGFSGKVIVCSRRGNFPKRHFETAQQNPDFISADDAKNGLLFITKKIRKFLRENPQYDLRHVIDSIRLITTKLWQNFDDKNKKLFLRFWPYWNIFRHRAPGASLDLIAQMNVEVRKKGVKNITKIGERFLVDETLCDVVVNCLGFDLKAKNYELLNQMLEENLLKPELLLASSNSQNLHLLGGLNIGRDFECTAVPDLRVSVEEKIKMI